MQKVTDKPGLHSRDLVNQSPDYKHDQADVETEATDLFQKQLAQLAKYLTHRPQTFQKIFIEDGMNAIAWEFQQDALSGNFTQILWQLLLREDDMSTILMRFIWKIPLKFKRKFIRAIDTHLADRYPMFSGLSERWPGENNIPP